MKKGAGAGVIIGGIIVAGVVGAMKIAASARQRKWTWILLSGVLIILIFQWIDCWLKEGLISAFDSNF